MRMFFVTPDLASVTLRPVVPGDVSFLHALYADRRERELEPLGWERPQQRAFIDMQFKAQQAGLATTFPEADHWVICVDDDIAGRLLVDRRADEHRVVDLAILTPFRGQGIGTALMEDVISDAREAGKPVHLTVAAHEERLVNWYRRLGFEVVDETSPTLSMVWSPD